MRMKIPTVTPPVPTLEWFLVAIPGMKEEIPGGS
jgi:hypothetical protein